MKEPEVTSHLVEACRRGDRDAFRALYDLYKDKVYAITLYYFHGDQAAAVDASQQVFLKVLTGIAKFRAEAGFATWLYRIVANVCHDHARGAGAREIATDASDFTQMPIAQTQEADLVRVESEAHVRAALASLPPKLRLPVLLRYFDDLSYAEMAEALGCSVGTIASRLNQAHAVLRRKLESLAKSQGVKHGVKQ